MSRIKTDDLVNDLFDFAVSSPEGFTRSDACRALGISSKQFNHGMRHLRLTLAGDTITIPCTPAGRGEEWTYRMAGTLGDCKEWATNRVVDSRARLETMAAVLASVVANTDGRTREGREAREMHMSLRHLLERLDLIGGAA